MKTRKISTIEDLATLIQSRFWLFDGKNNKLKKRNELRDIKFELKRKVTRDEFEELEKRVIGLEKLSFAR